MKCNFSNASAFTTEYLVLFCWPVNAITPGLSGVLRQSNRWERTSLTAFISTVDLAGRSQESGNFRNESSVNGHWMHRAIWSSQLAFVWQANQELHGEGKWSEAFLCWKLPFWSPLTSFHHSRKMSCWFSPLTSGDDWMLRERNGTRPDTQKLQPVIPTENQCTMFLNYVHSGFFL